MANSILEDFCNAGIDLEAKTESIFRYASITLANRAKNQIIFGLFRGAAYLRPKVRVVQTERKAQFHASGVTSMAEKSPSYVKYLAESGVF